jgi:UPF0176 protein
MSKKVANIAAYRFVDLTDRDELRQPLRDLCNSLSMKGTILLAHEGINIFLSASQESCENFLSTLAEDERFANLDVKWSYSDEQPFTRMLVRLKNEIITIRKSEIKPSSYTGPFIESSELKSWYDQEKDFIIIDTRNDYETKFGMFKDAIDLDIRKFTEFEDALSQLPEESKDKPVVMYCTGGVRCEKASVVMLEAGWKEVYQLDGGILRYIEHTGGAHWDGECFVFDRRVCLDENLAETEAELCFACREPLTPEEQKSPDYVVGQSCSYCI